MPLRAAALTQPAPPIIVWPSRNTMESNELATQITRLSLNRRVTMFVLFLTILAVGLIAMSRLQLELFRRNLDNLSIRFDRRLAEVPQDHLAIRGSNLLPGLEHDIIQRLLDVEL